MVSVEPQSFNMFPRHMSNDPEDFNSHYPEPPQGVASFGPIDMSLYPPAMGFDANNGMYVEQQPAFMFDNRMSPGMYPEDGEMRVPSSNLSNASIPSAPSSAVGSPRSNHGQPPAPVSGWPGPHMGMSPGIVGQSEYFATGTEYSFPGPGMDEFPPFAFTDTKPPGFVGELSHPRSSSTLSRNPSGSVSSSVSCESSTTATTTTAAGLAVDTQLDNAAAASPISPPMSRKSSIAFTSPTSTSSFSSPPAPSWGSPTTPRLVHPFFSQSSGHFVAPLESSYPSLIHPEINRSMGMQYDNTFQPPNSAYPTSPALTSSPQIRTGSTSPFMPPNSNYHFSPYPAPMDQGRRPSMVSFHSNYSAEQPYSSDESKEKQRCPHPDCGKQFKDLKAHMLTHQTERPEKCPIQTCDYHIKGFARKYDKNRHTLTHYKGTMVCGFCPGSGSAAEKSFNRADVFKRHLTAVHGVEQTPPNSRKKTSATSTVNSGKKLTGYAPDATGKCSTCSQTFSNAQDFYEHLDDCVLRIVQQEDPAEAINAKRLAEVENDREVHETLEKANLPTTTQTSSASEDDEDDDMGDDEDAMGEEDFKALGIKTSSPTKKNKGNPANGVQKSRGMTHSRGGVPLPVKTRGRKNRKDYPSSWGFDKGQMTMKKRVMAVFDGPRRLAKDDMMLSTEHEVRVKLSDGKAYVTDLDVQTLKRAEGFLGATDEEKGPWVSDDPTDEELKQMLEFTKPLQQ